MTAVMSRPRPFALAVSAALGVLAVGLAACGARSTLGERSGDSFSGGDDGGLGDDANPDARRDAPDDALALACLAEDAAPTADCAAGLVACRGTCCPALSVGPNHACAIVRGGGIKCWGSNEYGEIGGGEDAMRALTAVKVAYLSRDITSVAAGRGHTCASTRCGAAACWGHSYFGELGSGTTDTSVPVPVSSLDVGVARVGVGKYHSCAVGVAGEGWCWGRNRNGEVGDGTRINTGVPSRVAAIPLFRIAGADQHSCAITDAGKVVCWGDNEHGQLGIGTLGNSNLAVDVHDLAAGAIAVATGGARSCAITRDGALRCWGENASGALGDGSNADRKSPVDVVGLSTGVISVATGDTHSCAVLAGGHVRCWGTNLFGELGDGTDHASNRPVDVVGLSVPAVVVGVGQFHTCVAAVDRQVYCWGGNEHGELGNGTVTPFPIPAAVAGVDL